MKQIPLLSESDLSQCEYKYKSENKGDSNGDINADMLDK